MNRFSIDIKGLEEYQLRVLKAANRLKDFELKFLNTLAGMVMEKVIPRTPVDTGRLRGSWKVSKVVQKGDTLEISIYNDARENGTDESYASYVEFGHFTRNRVSWVEGVGMLRASTLEVTAEMKRVWNILFDEFVKEMNL